MQSRLGPALEALLCLAVSAVLSVRWGMDGNWDLQNYHLYDAFALLDGRLDTDLFAAHLQSYFNPLLDLPFFMALRVFPAAPRVVTALAGIPYGLALVVGLRLGAVLARRLPGVSSWEGRAAALLGLTGTVLLSELGTTFGDIPIAVLVLAGLLLEIRALETPNARAWPFGLLLGAAAGLKLTSMLFAPAGLLGLLLTARNWRQAMRLALSFCGAWGVGLLITDGWWAWMLQAEFGNPAFPLFNSLFRSPWFDPISFRDLNFMPRSLGQALFYPFYWLSGQARIVTEVPLRDARFAGAYLATGLIAFLALTGFRQARRAPAVADPAARLIIGFFVVSFIVWEAEFSMLRYILALEALTGLIIWLGLSLVISLSVTSPHWAALLRWAGLAMTALFLAWTSLPTDWGRLPPGHSIAEISAPALPDGSTVLMVGAPIGFVMPFLHAPEVAFYNLGYLSPGGPGAAKLRARLAGGKPVAVVTNQDPGQWHERLTPFNLALDPAGCQPIANTRQAEIRLCPLVRTGG